MAIQQPKVISAMMLQSKKLTNRVDVAKRSDTKIRPKAVGDGIFGCVSNFDKCRLKVTGEVISFVAIVQVGMDVCVKFGDSRLNSCQIIRLLPAEPVLPTFVQHLAAFCSRQEAAIGVISVWL